ncbi:MAG: transcriptional regulator [Planctomycetes bacterium]|nr:transcriptional regulator [Planctomycetota bacterium]
MSATGATDRAHGRTHGRGDPEAPFAYSALDRIFHERGRLAVCTCLVAFPGGLSFCELKEECGMTDGNLNRHLAALAEMKIVALHKKAKGRRPVTICKITRYGRERFLAYIDALETVVRDAQARALLARSPARAAETGLATT